MIKKYVSTLTVLFFLCNISIAQKLYIWCPEETVVKPRIGFLEKEEVNLVLFDARTIPAKSKVECEASAITQSIISTIRQAYPSTTFAVQPESEYYKPSKSNALTIKIGIASYHAGFGTDVTVGIGSVGGNFTYNLIPKGEWNGLVSYYVQVFDNRGDLSNKFSREISEITSKSNMLGYKTARTCLNTSYNKANQTLLSFIEQSLMR